MTYRGALLAAVIAAALSRCASTDVTPVAQNVVLVSTSAAPACGRQGARKLAFLQAAAETLRRGYDRFIIVGAEGDSDVRIVGTTPVYGTTSIHGSSYGSTFSATGRTTMYGGDPIYGGSHNQQFAVRMFRASDQGADNAIDARAELGPNWEKRIKEKKLTCF